MNDRETTLAIVLGASKWPKSPGLSAGRAFRNSAHDFIGYLLEGDHFKLPNSNLLNLFDSEASPPELIERISVFIQERKEHLKERELAPLDLIVFYVGHGSFAGSDYILALRNTNSEIEAPTSLRMIDLASTIQSLAPQIRRYVILDCCFAAAAYQQFQTAPIEIAVQRTASAFPTHGTALLCASGAKDPAKAPPDAHHTMFSGAFLRVLHTGSAASPGVLSLFDVGQLTAELIHNEYADKAVRPEVHTPEQRAGDVAQIPLFPNAAFRIDTSKRLSLIEDRLTAIEKSAGATLVRAESDRSTEQIPVDVLLGLHAWRRARILGSAWFAGCALTTVTVVYWAISGMSTSVILYEVFSVYRWALVAYALLVIGPRYSRRRGPRDLVARQKTRSLTLLARVAKVYSSARVLVTPAVPEIYGDQGAAWRRSPHVVAAQSEQIAEFFTVPLESVRFYAGNLCLLVQWLVLTAWFLLKY